MPDEPFSIITVPDDAVDQIEAMGTKPKFWFVHPDLGKCLYKEARPRTGEDWAEKVAAELAELLGLPHAQFELAKWCDTLGTVSPSFVRRGHDLVHGNELLLWVDRSHPTPQGGTERFYRVTAHTLDAVLGVLKKVAVALHWTPPSEIRNGADVFVGYLMLDALIGNTDRHHENWGIVVCLDQSTGTTGISLHIAPTYDHASSLGRELTDSERSERLNTADRGRSVTAYVEKGHSALYNKKDDVKPLTVIQAFREAAGRFPLAGRIWLERLAKVSAVSMGEILSRVPEERMSRPAHDFAAAVLV